MPSSGSTIHTRSAESRADLSAAFSSASSDRTAVVGPVGREQLHQQLVGGLVAGVLELTPLETLAAHFEQPLPRDRRQPLGQHVVVGTGWRGAVAVVVRHAVTLARHRRAFSG